MGFFDWFFQKTKSDNVFLTERPEISPYEERPSDQELLLRSGWNSNEESPELYPVENQEDVHREILDAFDNARSFPSGFHEKEFDVFLAHNSFDKPFVRYIANTLRDKGLKPWLDEEQILPGTFFQDVIQQAINKVRSAAIVIGSNELGKWQLMELRAFISVLVEKDIPVIPVLLPGINRIPDNLYFLQQLNWVAFSEQEDEEAFRQLIRGITGQHNYDNRW